MIVNEGGGGPAPDCHELDEFTEAVVPQMQVCADMCHGGANPKANATMDLSTLESDPGKACAQVRTRILPGDLENSQIILVTDPQPELEVGEMPPAHAFKFAGNKNQYAAFKAAVSPWIVLEAQ